MLASILFVAPMFLLFSLTHSQYVVTLQRTNGHFDPGAQTCSPFPQPILSSQFGKSIFDFNYNPSYVPLYANGKLSGDALMVRCQNAYTNGTLGPSVMGLAVANQSLSGSNAINFQNINQSQVVFQPMYNKI